MKNKLKPLVLGLVLLLSNFNIYANYPVIDISAIMTAVNQLYTMYDEVDSMITQVQQGYEQLQCAVEAAKNWEMDWSNWNGAFDASSPGSAWKSLDIRGELFGTLNQIDALQNRIMEIESIFDDKQLQFLNGSGVTVTELLGFKHDAVINGIETGEFAWKNNLKKAWGKVLTATEDDLKQYKKVMEVTQYMTEVERAMWKKTHPGYSPEQHAVAKIKEKEVTDKLKQAVMLASDEAQEIMSEHNTLASSNLIKEILEKNEQTEPELLQKIALLLNNMTNIINDMSLEVYRFHGDVAQAFNDTMKASNMGIGRNTSGNVTIFDEEKMKTKYDVLNDYVMDNDF